MARSASITQIPDRSRIRPLWKEIGDCVAIGKVTPAELEPILRDLAILKAIPILLIWATFMQLGSVALSQFGSMAADVGGAKIAEVGMLPWTVTLNTFALALLVLATLAWLVRHRHSNL